METLATLPPKRVINSGLCVLNLATNCSSFEFMKSLLRKV